MTAGGDTWLHAWTALSCLLMSGSSRQIHRCLLLAINRFFVASERIHQSRHEPCGIFREVGDSGLSRHEEDF